MIINIRGTNGLGKSHVVQAVMDRLTARPVYGMLGPQRPEAYRLGLDASWWVLGPYNGAIKRGVDCINPYDRIIELLEAYTPRGHLIFEGLLVSGNIGRVGELLALNEGVAAYLQTPLATCIQRVEARRVEHGVGGLYDPAKKLAPKFREVARCRDRMMRQGLVRVVDLSSEDPVKDVLALMAEAQ